MSGHVRMEGIVKRHGSFTALYGVDLTILPGEFFALLGPSGSGKTTTLRILAGLEPANEGRVILDDVDVTAKEPGERDVAMVFQSYALYPHMSVGENIGFPLRMIGTPRDELERAVRDAAAKVHIDHLLARAIVRKPRLFLLDEPLSNLDAKLRLETRVELRKLQRALGVTTVYVTHDQEEAMTIADRVAVFMEGRIAQIGRPQDIFARPATAIVAGFIGSPPMNLLPAEIRAGMLHVAGVDLRIDRALGPDAAVTLGVRPAALRIAPTGLPARVYLIEDLGDTTIIDLDIAGQVIKLRTDQLPNVREGDHVHVAFPTHACHLFDRASGVRRDE